MESSNGKTSLNKQIIEENCQNETVENQNEQNVINATAEENCAPSTSKECDQKEVKKIRIQNWLVETLAWSKRTEMADSALSTSSSAFNYLCWPKLHGFRRRVPWLAFWHGRDESGRTHQAILERNGQRVDIATLPLPDNIEGFDKITFYFLNDQILEFIHNILPKLINVDLNICNKFYKWKPESVERKIELMGRLLALLTGKIYKLNFYQIYGSDETGLEHFHGLFPDILDQVEFICVSAEGKNDYDILYEWLSESRENGKTKRLLRLMTRNQAEQNEFVENIKFIFSFVPTSGQSLLSDFVILLDFPHLPFTMENEQIGQHLCLYTKLDEQFNYNRNYLAKYSNGEEYWKDEGAQKILQNPENKTSIYLQI